MHALVSPIVDAIEGLVRTFPAKRNLKSLPDLTGIPPNDDYLILVAAYNEATRPSNTPGLSRLDKHLEVLRPWQDKIILVDDGSTDCTAEIARKAGYNVFRSEENGHKSGSILKVLRILNTEYIVIADLDTYPDPNSSSLEAVARLVGWVDTEGLGGSCATLLPYIRPKPRFNRGSFSDFVAILMDCGSYCLEILQLAEYVLAMRLTRASQNTPDKQHIMIISGGFGVYRREPYMQACAQFVRHPDRFMGMEDVFNTNEIARMGLRTGYLPDVVVRTEVPFTLQGLVKQRDIWERATIRNVLIHCRMLLQLPGYRLEAAWTYFHTVLLRPFKFLSVGPFLAYGIIHPDLLLVWYVSYVLILLILLRLYSTSDEFRLIRLVILLLPVYSFVLNTFVYTKAWLEEILFQLGRHERNARLQAQTNNVP